MNDDDDKEMDLVDSLKAKNLYAEISFCICQEMFGLNRWSVTGEKILVL